MAASGRLWRLDRLRMRMKYLKLLTLTLSLSKGERRPKAAKDEALFSGLLGGVLTVS